MAHTGKETKKTVSPKRAIRKARKVTPKDAPIPVNWPVRKPAEAPKVGG
jgi:hypothetical protein